MSNWKYILGRNRLVYFVGVSINFEFHIPLGTPQVCRSSTAAEVVLIYQGKLSALRLRALRSGVVNRGEYLCT